MINDGKIIMEKRTCPWQEFSEKVSQAVFMVKNFQVNQAVFMVKKFQVSQAVFLNNRISLIPL